MKKINIIFTVKRDPAYTAILFLESSYLKILSYVFQDRFLHICVSLLDLLECFTWKYKLRKILGELNFIPRITATLI